MAERLLCRARAVQSGGGPCPSRSILSEVNHQLESRMREIRLSGSEGGGAEFNRLSLPLFITSGNFPEVFSLVEAVTRTLHNFCARSRPACRGCKKAVGELTPFPRSQGPLSLLHTGRSLRGLGGAGAERGPSPGQVASPLKAQPNSLWTWRVSSTWVVHITTQLCNQTNHHA